MKRFLRYFALAGAIIVTLWLVLILTLYFVIDVDFIKSKMKEVVEKNTYATLNVEDIKIKFFPILYLEVKELTLTSTKNNEKVFYTKDLDFSFNIISLLKGAPVVNLSGSNPSINFIQKNGTNNIQELIKIKEVNKTTDEKTNTSIIETKDYLLVAKVAIDFKSIVINYKDELSSTTIEVPSLSLIMDPVLRTFILSLNINLKNEAISGPLFIKSNVSYSSDVFEGDLNINADKLSIKELKSASDSLSLSSNFSTNLNDLNIKNGEINFFGDKLDINGKVNNFTSPSVSLFIKSDSLKLEKYKHIVEAIDDFRLFGILSFDLKLNGKVEGPVFAFNAKYIESESDLMLNLKNESKNVNLITGNLKSNNFKLISTKKNKAKNTLKEEVKNTKNSKSNLSDEYIIEPSVITSIKNLKQDLSLDIDFKKINFNSLILENLKSQILMSKSGGVFKITSCNIFGGDLKTNFNLSTVKDEPAYTGNLELKNLKASEAINIFTPELKGSAEGVLKVLDVKFNSTGTKESIFKKNLVANGFIEMNNFKYNKEILSKNLDNLLSENIKLNLSTSKIIKKDFNWDELKVIFDIAKQKVNLKTISAKNIPYEVKGKGVLDFDTNLDLFLDFIVPYKDLSYEYLKYDKNRSMLPVHIKGTANAPSLDSGYTLKYVAEKKIKAEANKIKKDLKKKISTDKNVDSFLKQVGF